MRAISRETELVKELNEHKSISYITSQVALLHSEGVSHIGILSLTGREAIIKLLSIVNKVMSDSNRGEKKIILQKDVVAPLLKKTFIDSFTDKEKRMDAVDYKEDIQRFLNESISFWELPKIETLQKEKRVYHPILSEIEVIFLLLPEEGIHGEDFDLVRDYFSSFGISLKGVFLDSSRIERRWWEFWK